jgi:hypothetical protein
MQGSGDGAPVREDSRRFNRRAVSAIRSAFGKAADDSRLRRRVVVDADRVAEMGSASSSQDSGAASPGFTLPFERLNIRSSSVRVQWRGRTWTIPLEVAYEKPEDAREATLNVTTAIQDSPIAVEIAMDARSAPTRVSIKGDRIDLAALATALPRACCRRRYTSRGMFHSTPAITALPTARRAPRWRWIGDDRRERFGVHVRASRCGRGCQPGQPS